MSRSALSLSLVGVLAIVLLTSCLGVDMNTRFNADGSGVIKMKLQISKALLQMSQEEGASPIPLTKQDVEEAYKDLPGVKVESVTEQNTDKDKIITATVSFKDFAVFKNTKDLAGTGASLTKSSDGTTTYSVTVGEPEETQGEAGVTPEPLPAEAHDAAGAGQGQSSEAQPADKGAAAPSDESGQAVDSMFKSLMEGYSLVYSVTAPRKVLSHTLGEVSNDGKTVTYSIKMADYVDLKAPLTFRVVW